jgi:hypothetical protein
MSTATQTSTASAPAPAVQEAKALPVPKFHMLPGNMQFSVEIPDVKQSSKWINELSGSFDQKSKSYVFLMVHLTAVEVAMGLAPGSSGLRDPSRYFPVSIKGYVTSEKFDELVALMKKAGFDYSKQKKTFEGPLENLDKITPYLPKK